MTDLSLGLRELSEPESEMRRSHALQNVQGKEYSMYLPTPHSELVGILDVMERSRVCLWWLI